VLVHVMTGAEVLVRAEDLYGRSMSRGVILVRKDSGINSIRDMKGKRFAFVDKATTAGYLSPLAYFKKMGIENYKTYLKKSTSRELIQRRFTMCWTERRISGL